MFFTSKTIFSLASLCRPELLSFNFLSIAPQFLLSSFKGNRCSCSNMYFSTALALFSALAISSAFPTHPSYTPIFPRGNATEEGECRDGSDVARGGKLKAEAVAEAHQRDGTATRAASAVTIKTSDGNCLTVNPCGGDFRSNLIPILTKACLPSSDPKSAQQKFDLITKGKHISQEGATLVVSALVRILSRAFHIAVVEF